MDDNRTFPDNPYDRDFAAWIAKRSHAPRAGECGRLDQYRATLPEFRPCTETDVFG